MNQITEAIIRASVSENSYERGHNYYRANAVDNVARRGNLVTADVEGSHYDPYQVQIVLNNSGIQSAICSCPYDWGGYCKHIVAVLLTLVHNAQAVEIKSGLAILLADLSEAQLRQLLLNVAEGDTAVTEAIEREINWLKETPGTITSTATAIPVDPKAIRREMRKSFQVATATGGGGYEYYDYDEGLEIFSNEIFGTHLQKVDDLLDAGEVATAVAVITVVIEAWIEDLTELDEWIYEYNEDVLGEDAQLLGAILAEVLLSMDMSLDEKDEWLKRIKYWEEALGDMGMVETAVAQGWDFPPLAAILQGKPNKYGLWENNPPYFANELCQVRLNILQRQERLQEYMYLAKAEGQVSHYVNMLAATAQFEKAVVEAKRILTTPAEAYTLARILSAKGETAKALEIGDHGLGLKLESDQFRRSIQRDQDMVTLAQWLSQQAESANNPLLALKATQTAFNSNHELADYQTAQRLAGKEWAIVKRALLQSLQADGRSSNQIDVYLHENMLVEAMLVVDKHPYGPDLIRVIEATRKAYPDWGIQKCKNQAETIMDAGKAKDYDTAVSWLQTAQTIYQQHRRLSEWKAYITTLLDKHTRKYKLIPMLRTIF